MLRFRLFTAKVSGSQASMSDLHGRRLMRVEIDIGVQCLVLGGGGWMRRPKALAVSSVSTMCR